MLKGIRLQALNAVMENKKKVLFVIPYMHEGGAQRALSNIQTHLADRFEMDTLVNSELNRAYPNAGKVISLNIDRKAKTSSPFFQFAAFVKRICRLRELKRSGRYSVCVSFVDSANIANIITRRCGGATVKTIISVRTSISRDALKLPQYRFIVRPLAKIMYKKADLVVSVSEELRHELIRDLTLNDKQVISIINGFDTEELKKQSEEDIDDSVKKKVANKKVVFTAGRLNLAKNQWHLIRAFSEVVKAIPDAVLVIAGSGELEEYLKDVVNSLNINENVIFLGFEKNVYRYLRISDVFMLPSGFEGFPNSLGEALCLGVPCIATDFRTGAREILAPELLFDGHEITKVAECTYGLLSPKCSGIRYRGNEPLERSETELANAMMRMLSDRELNNRYRIKSIERAEDLDICGVIDKWSKAIKE